MSEKRAETFFSPGFILGLFLLLLNDFALKAAFPGWITGKLSDFAGLFVFSLFLMALLPHFKLTICLLICSSFCFWKSAYSEPFIEAWNNFNIVPISRVVDYTDLTALCVLPLACLYRQYLRPILLPNAFGYVMVCLSLLAFCATSYKSKVAYNEKFNFQMTTTSLIRRMYHLSHINPDYSVSNCISSNNPNEFDIRMPADICFKKIFARVSIAQAGEQSVLSLTEVSHSCPSGDNDKRVLLEAFQKGFVDRLDKLQMKTETHSSEAPNDNNAAGRTAIYLLPIGDKVRVNLEETARYFKKRFQLAAKILPVIQVEDWVRVSEHSRPVAERLVDLIKRTNPSLAASDEAVIIGVTEDMYVSTSKRVLDVDYRSDERFAVISVRALDPATFCEPSNQPLLETRFRKSLAKNIAFLYYRLPRSADPTDVSYSSVDCVDELDGMREDFEFFPSKRKH